MSKYELLTEELRAKTLNGLEKTENQLKQYGYPENFILAIELEKKIIKGLPVGMIVPIRE